MKGSFFFLKKKTKNGGLPGDSVEGLVVVVVVAGRIGGSLRLMMLSELWCSGLEPSSRDKITSADSGA